MLLLDMTRPVPSWAPIGLGPPRSIMAAIIGSCLLVTLCQAQDIHLSHIHASPTHLNPAMTGLTLADMRFIANYRGQWNSFTKGYRTVVASGDMKLNKGFGTQDDVGVGLMLLADQAGDLNFTTLSAGLSMAYHKSLNDEGSHFISAGLVAGIVENRLDLANAKTKVQFDPFLHHPDFVSKFAVFDVSAGLAWFVPFGRNNHVYAGASLSHINRALVSFNRNLEDRPDSHFLFRKTVLHGGANLNVNYFLTLKPSFIYFSQGPHREMTFGTFFTYNPTDEYVRPEYRIYLGAWLRWSFKDADINRDAIIASVRYDIRNTIFSLSYDINISPLTKASSGQGGPELSIIHNIDFIRPERIRFRVKCPEF